MEVEIPILIGSSNWVSFSDKFIMKFSLTSRNRGFNLKYVVDNQPGVVTRATKNLAEENILDLKNQGHKIWSSLQM